MMMAVSNQERIEVLQEVLVKMDEIAHALRSLHDSEIDAYCLAAFEGRNGGWLGRFERDILQERLQAWWDGDSDDGEEEPD